MQKVSADAKSKNIDARKGKKNVVKKGIRTPANKVDEKPTIVDKLSLESHALTTRPSWRWMIDGGMKI
jgi:hypothetical protein